MRRSLHRHFYAGMTKEREKALRDSSIAQRMPGGRDTATLLFEQCLRVASLEEKRASDIHVVLLRAGTDEVSRKGDAAYHLRRAADCYRDTATRTIYAVEPNLGDSFEVDEAQVEMITTYRNILLEAYALRPVTTLSIPALCLREGTAGRYSNRVPKMNQMSVIKGFHRISEDAQDYFTEIAHRKELAIRIAVPEVLLPLMQSVYQEEPWPYQRTIMHLGRTDFYNQTTPPRQLQETAPGWVGKRKELEAGVPPPQIGGQ